VRLMSKYNLRSLFTAEMTGLHMHLYLFERLLEDYEPALYCHLHRRGVPPNLYATQWFLTLFAYRFPLQLVLRVYDLVLSEGLGAILKFGIALMQRNAQTLLGMKDMVQLSTHLKERLFDVYIDKSPSATSILESGFFGSTSGTDKEVYRADALVRDACAVVIAPETLATYTSEFEEKARAEKDREIELESLRNENANLSTRVRKLELRTQQSDAEHVDLASSLVRTKVENDSLLDENESLKMQVEELRKMVDKQPQEVEDRLKAEMDQIMARNIEVQDRNRGLEEQVHEMEQE
ncbi:RabGAP/TBC, partial [Aureobasidium melanogenum]